MVDGVKTGRRGPAVRLLASFIDVFFGIVVALLLSGSTGRWFAARAVAMLSIGSPDSAWRGPLPMVLGIFGDFVYGLPFALLLVLLTEVFFAAGPGKWALGMRVSNRDCTRAPAGRRLLRWAAKCIGLLGLVVALSIGSGAVAALSLAMCGILLAGLALASGSGRLALHDRFAGTAVC